MDELNFNDDTDSPKHSRYKSGSRVKPEPKLTRKQNRFREIEQRLEEQRLKKELQDLFP